MNQSNDPTKKKRANLASPIKGIEVTIVCTYDKPSTWTTDDIEFARLKANQWAPTLDDFLAVAATPHPAKGPPNTVIERAVNVNSMLTAIHTDDQGKPRPSKSVRRVNIIGHGNPGLIGLWGTVSDTGSVQLGQPNTADQMSGGGFDESTAKWLNDEGKAERDKVRRVLTDDADVALILCHSGMLDGKKMMKELAKAFNAKVQGYLEAINYRPCDDDYTTFGDRRLTSLSTAKGTFHPGYPCVVNVPPALRGTHLAFSMAPVDKPTTMTP